jgi:hypothetical protein
MSFSQPFFGNKAGYKKQQITGYDDDAIFNSLHWTEQLRIRPLRDRKVWPRAEGDYDNRLDNFDTEDINYEETDSIT